MVTPLKRTKVTSITGTLTVAMVALLKQAIQVTAVFQITILVMLRMLISMGMATPLTPRMTPLVTQNPLVTHNPPILIDTSVTMAKLLKNLSLRRQLKKTATHTMLDIPMTSLRMVQ